MASLQPVYEQIKDVQDKDIQLVELGVSSDEPKEAHKDDKCCSEVNNEKSCRNGKRSFARRLCGCCCGFFIFGVMLWMISGAAFVSYMGVKTYRCVHPRHQSVTTFIFEDNEVNEFDIGVVSGFINVRTCPMADKITLVVARRSSQPELLETMPLEKSLAHGIFKLNVLAPSFDFQHCQSASIDLIIPQKLADKLHLSLKAQTILGKITVNTPKHTFDKLSLFANLGLVKAADVRVNNAFEAEARVGVVHADHVKAKGGVLRTTFGALCVQQITVDEAEFHVETGRATLNYVEAKKVTITSELGWISAWSLGQLQTLDARVDYGRLNVSPGADWSGKFTVESPYGWIDASHAKDAIEPLLEKNTPAVISGKYKVAADAKEVSTMTMKAIYGAVNFFLPSPPRAA